MKTALLIVAVVAVTVSVWHWRGKSAAVSSDDQLVANRMWIDHLPKTERDTIQIFALLDDEALGIFQATSAWRGQHELFRFEAQGDELRAVFPQTGDKETIKARARRCDVKGMDFCLELEGASHGVKRYFSREGWEIGNAHDTAALDRRIDSLERTLGTTGE